MTAAAAIWRTDRSQLIALAGAGVAVAALLLNLGFLFRPGTTEVLGGLAHHGFVLGLMLVLTSGSRTVSLGTLAIFWLLGVWGVYALAYIIEQPLASQFGAESADELVPVWLAPITEEACKLLPVALFYALSIRRGRQPSMSDGMLLGFMVGAGVSFQEDAHIGAIQLSGEGWGSATPWSTLFPTITPVGDLLALNHALWASLSGLSLGAVVMLRHWRVAWLVALIGPAAGLTNHIMLNHFAPNVFEITGRAKAPAPFSTIRDLTDGGRLPLEVLIVGVVAVVFAERLIVRWAGTRDRMFPPLAISRLVGLLMRAGSKAGAAQLIAADRYLCLRRSAYFGAWRTKRAGGHPDVNQADFVQLSSLAGRLEVLPSFLRADMAPVETVAADDSAIAEPAAAVESANDAPAEGA